MSQPLITRHIIFVKLERIAKFLHYYDGYPVIKNTME